MISKEELSVYLTDHLGGAAAGQELAERLRSQNEGSPVEGFLAQLALDITVDRETLADLMDRLGITKSAAKQAGGWVLEKLTRIKYSEKLTRSADVSRLFEMETLSLGIEGKLAMWRSLKEVAHEDPQLSKTNFDDLIQRAQLQLDGLERHRQEAAARAFTASSVQS
jgi:hypothetical protein